MVEHLLQKVPAILIVAVIAFWFLVFCYGILRLLRIPTSWIIWIVCSTLCIASAWFSVTVLLQSHSLQTLTPLMVQSDALGFIAFLLLVYAVSQWTMRRWYLLIKQRAWPFLVNSSHAVMFFLRKHHQLFGWATLATATAHLLYFVPLLLLQPQQTAHTQRGILTGTLAWIVLVCLVILGLRVEQSIKQKHMSKKARVIHFTTALVFISLAVFHVGLV